MSVTNEVLRVSALAHLQEAQQVGTHDANYLTKRKGTENFEQWQNVGKYYLRVSAPKTQCPGATSAPCTCELQRKPLPSRKRNRRPRPGLLPPPRLAVWGRKLILVLRNRVRPKSCILDKVDRRVTLNHGERWQALSQDLHLVFQMKDRKASKQSSSWIPWILTNSGIAFLQRVENSRAH